jgi:hypothetical protein
MPQYSAIRHIWRAIYPLLLYFGITFAVIFIAVLIRPDIAEDNGWLMIISSAVCIAVFALIWRKARTRLSPYGNTGTRLLPVLVTALGFAALNFVFVAVGGLFDLVSYFPSYEQIIEIFSNQSLLVSVLSAGIAAPFLEELLYRGILLNRLMAWMPAWAAVVVSGALFGAMHLNLYQGLYAFAASIPFALLYIRCRNLWLPIAGHMAFNLANIALIEITEAAGIEAINPWLLLIPSALATVGCVWFMLQKTKPAEALIQEQNPCPTD